MPFQGASLAPPCIVWYQTLIKAPTSKVCPSLPLENYSENVQFLWRHDCCHPKISAELDLCLPRLCGKHSPDTLQAASRHAETPFRHTLYNFQSPTKHTTGSQYNLRYVGPFLLVNKPCHQNWSPGTNIITKNGHQNKPLYQKWSSEKYFTKNQHLHEPCDQELTPGKNLVTKISFISE